MSGMGDMHQLRRFGGKACIPTQRCAGVWHEIRWSWASYMIMSSCLRNLYPFVNSHGEDVKSMQYEKG